MKKFAENEKDMKGLTSTEVALLLSELFKARGICFDIAVEACLRYRAAVLRMVAKNGYTRDQILDQLLLDDTDTCQWIWRDDHV